MAVCASRPPTLPSGPPSHRPQVQLEEEPLWDAAAAAGDAAAAAGDAAAAARAAARRRPEEARLSVLLWRADALAGVVEVASSGGSGAGAGLAVVKADPVAGLIFGTGARGLYKRDLCR